MNILAMIPAYYFLAATLWTLPEVNCAGCDKKVRDIFMQIDGADVVSVDIQTQVLCIEGTFDSEKAIAALQDEGYSVRSQQVVDKCVVASPTSLWAGVAGDVQVVSTGERISLRKLKVDGKYTLFDFGATWCAPCLTSTRQLAEVLQQRSDFAVRAIELEDAAVAFETPVAFQHLSDASGIPWFILIDTNGKEIYRGNDLQTVLSLLP